MSAHRSPILALRVGGAATGLAMIGLAAITLSIPAQVEAQSRGPWVMPRTADGKPDLQGNWSNATITPIQRPQGQGPVLTPEQVAEIEGTRQEYIDEEAAPSDPDRDAPPVGGDGSTGAAGGVGGYNYFFIDAGDRVAMVDGEPRSSLITVPADGRRPGLTEAARARFAERRAFTSQFGQYDNPENRPLAERCILSFGSNAGPPMLPNYFYNNNYTIVQTPDHVMIMTEMVHDTRVIRLGERRPLPEDVAPWFGDSWGWWEGDTLVVETTNINPDQALQGIPPTPTMKITERFTRADENTINYEFMVEDPATYEEPWGGQVPFTALPELVYEYACHEGNYALSNVLSGARAEEARGSRDQPQNQR
jgi:hypothetical protein